RPQTRWLLPTPGGPNSSTLAPRSSHSCPSASAITCAFETLGTAANSKLESPGRRSKEPPEERRDQRRRAVPAAARAGPGKRMKAAWYETNGPARDVLTVGEMPDPI